MKHYRSQWFLMIPMLFVVLGMFYPSGVMAKQKSVDKAKAYCSAAGFPAKKCKECGKKNSRNCKCCYKAKPFWCPKGLAKAPTSYGLYKVCIKGKKSKAVLRDLSKIKNAAVTLNPASITKAYDMYFGWVSSGKLGKKQALSSKTIKKYQPFYKADLTKVKIAESKRVHGRNAMTNCKTIWFPKGSGMLKNPDSNIHWFAHELEHYEQCMSRGGKRRYANMWFGQVGSNWAKLALNGKSGDINHGGLHDAMPMEKNADKKADKVLKALSR
ncbi:MAG: hypothetical protein ACPGYT_09335 [Nitrospirales bacterium]